MGVFIPCFWKKKRGGHSALLNPSSSSSFFFFQMSLAQNNPYVKVAYFKVACFVTLQYPSLKHQHVIFALGFLSKGLSLKPVS